MFPAVTDPLSLPQVALVAEQEPITKAAGSVIVSEQVTELQLSLAVRV